MREIADTGFDWADVVDEAVDRSGGKTATADDVIKVRRGFRLLTERWNALGYNLWRLTTTTAYLSGLTPSITLPGDVDDVVNVGVSTVGTSVRLPAMRRLSEAEYAALPSKTVEGMPTQFCLRRTTPPEMMVFPIGRPYADHELEITFVARPGQFARYDDPKVAEVAGRWLEALVLGLARDLARKRPPYNETTITRLKAEAAEAEALALQGDRGRQPYRYRIGRR